MFYGCNRTECSLYELRLKAQLIFEHVIEHNITGWQRKYIVLWQPVIRCAMNNNVNKYIGPEMYEIGYNASG
jgi:hypothetical protein